MSDNKESEFKGTATKGKLLQLHKSGPDEDIVSALRLALEEAEKGAVTGGVLLLQGPGGAIRQEIAGDFHSGDLMLQWRQVELDLMEIEFGDSDDDPDDDPDDGERRTNEAPR